MLTACKHKDLVYCTQWTTKVPVIEILFSFDNVKNFYFLFSYDDHEML